MLCAYPSQRHEMLFDAHTRAFTALGGIPKRGIYDNMKTAVDKVRRGEERIVNTRFHPRFPIHGRSLFAKLSIDDFESGEDCSHTSGLCMKLVASVPDGIR